MVACSAAAAASPSAVAPRARVSGSWQSQAGARRLVSSGRPSVGACPSAAKTIAVSAAQLRAQPRGLLRRYRGALRVCAVATPDYDISRDLNAQFRVEFNNSIRSDATMVQVIVVRESKPNLVNIQQMILASFQSMEEFAVIEANLSIVHKTAKSEMFCTGPNGQIHEVSG